MPIFLLDTSLVFPDPNEANEDGLLAVGGDLSEDRLIMAYERGIFPWYNEYDPILWWSPDPRCVLYIEDLKISKSMRNVLNQKKFTYTFDVKFEEVMRNCQKIERKDDGTWINEDLIQAYCKLHRHGVAHSVEVYENEILVGGLYGMSLGNMFFGESMFSKKSNASKAALIYLCKTLKSKGFELIDCQIYNDHLGSLGATEIPRVEFLNLLEKAMHKDSIIGSWNNM